MSRETEEVHRRTSIEEKIQSETDPEITQRLKLAEKDLKAVIYFQEHKGKYVHNEWIIG